VVNDGAVTSNTATTTMQIKFPPTLTTVGPVETTTEETEVEIDFLEITTNGDEADPDGTVTAFVVQAVSTGTLRIGTTAASATAFAPSTNDVISSDLGLKAFWTPDLNASGTLSAFTILARDNEDILSVGDVRLMICQSQTMILEVQMNQPQWSLLTLQVMIPTSMELLILLLSY
jgi:hypothetical protein